MNRNRTIGTLLLVAAVVGIMGTASFACAQVIELRRFSVKNPDNGDLVQTYPGGANITITNSMGLGNYLIRSSDAGGPNNPPTLSVGEVSLEVTNQSSGTLALRFAKSFNQIGVGYEGVVDCGGVIDRGNPGVYTVLWLSNLTGDLTGNLDVDEIGSFELLGSIDAGVDILAWDTMEHLSLIARSIGGGVTIRCLGDNGNGSMNGLIRAGWPNQSNPNGATIGAPGNPVVISADYVPNQDLGHVWSYGDLYLEAHASRQIASIRTSFQLMPPNGLSDFDADVSVECTKLIEIKVPYGDDQNLDPATLSGSIHVTGTDGFDGQVRSRGTFAANMTIDYGLSGSNALFLLLEDHSLTGQVVINNADGGGIWDPNVPVQVGSDSLQQGYTETSAEIGGGAVGVAPFNFHATNCDPADGTTVTSEPGFVVLSHYGPVEKGGNQSGTELMIVRHPTSMPSPCSMCDEDVTADFTWEYASNGRDIIITPVTGQAFEDGYKYHITPVRSGSTVLQCAGVSGNPVVQDYDYDFTVDAL